MSEFARDCLKMDLLKYQEMLLDSYKKDDLKKDDLKKDDLKRNDILQKRFGAPMKKQNLKGLNGEIIIDEFYFKDNDK